MAAFSERAASHHEVSVGQRVNVARVRLACALAVSAFLHLWLAAGTDVDAPNRPPLPAARTLTAQLQRVAERRDLEAQPDQEFGPSDRVERRLEGSQSRRLPQRLRETAENGENHAPPAAPSVGAPRATAFAQPSADPTYYPARELDVYPASRTPLRFEYPERAVRERTGGKVLVALRLDETGAVDDVSIVRGEPPGYFEDAARAVLAAAQFSPARKDGRAVKSRVLINVEFEPGAAEGALR